MIARKTAGGLSSSTPPSSTLKSSKAPISYLPLFVTIARTLSYVTSSFIAIPKSAKKQEARVAQKAQQIQRLAVELRSDRAADGIGLIERVRHQFRDDPPFPIYAYTSKGPYLLQDEGFDRLEKLDARWLFKGRYSPQMERHRITKDIAEFEEHKQWTRRVWNAALRAGIVGVILGVILDRLARVVGI